MNQSKWSNLNATQSSQTVNEHEHIHTAHSHLGIWLTCRWFCVAMYSGYVTKLSIRMWPIWILVVLSPAAGLDCFSVTALQLRLKFDSSLCFGRRVMLHCDMHVEIHALIFLVSVSIQEIRLWCNRKNRRMPKSDPIYHVQYDIANVVYIYRMQL